MQFFQKCFFKYSSLEFLPFPRKKNKRKKNLRTFFLTKLFLNMFILKKKLNKISIQKLYFLSGYNDIQHNISPAVLQVQKGFLKNKLYIFKPTNILYRDCKRNFKMKRLLSDLTIETIICSKMWKIILDQTKLSTVLCCC